MSRMTSRFIERLPTITDGEQPSWEKLTRVYALVNFADAVYRVMDAEMFYRSHFRIKQAVTRNRSWRVKERS